MKRLTLILIAAVALALPASAHAENSLTATYGRDTSHFRINRNEEEGHEQRFHVFVRPLGVSCSAPLPNEGMGGAPDWEYEPSESNEYQYPGSGDYTVCATLSFEVTREQNPEGPTESYYERTRGQIIRLETTSVELNKRRAEVETENAAFTPSATSAVLRARIITEHPDAIFPGREGLLCPEIYPNEATGKKYSICFAEFRTGSVWHLVSTSAYQGEHGTITFPYGLHDSRWHRRWTRCSLRGWQTNQKVRGTLIANNGCIRGPQSDAYFIAIEGYYAARFRPGRSLGWQFTQSAGFNSLGIFRRQGHSYTFTNAVGDSFRYTPRY